MKLESLIWRRVNGDGFRRKIWAFSGMMCLVASTGYSSITVEEAFLENYCYECHDEDSKKGSLNLVELMRNPAADSIHYDLWVKVFDRVDSHEMPPKKKDAPTGDERAAFLRGLNRGLIEISKKHRKSEGRSPLRRLNRVEYENTLRDLLGIGVKVQHLLPEDNIVDGFDNVGKGLDTSATHLVRYQEAAELALEATYPPRILDGKVEAPKIRLTGREYLEGRQAVHRKGIDPYSKLIGDSFVYGAQLYKHGSVQTPRAKVAGRYVIRASFKAMNSKVPIPVDIGRISTDRFGHEKLEHLLDIRDAQPDKSQVVEVSAYLPAGESIYLSPRTLTLFRNLKKDDDGKPILPDFSEPFLVVDWIELEGPIGGGVGYPEFFGNWPRFPHRFLEDKFIVSNFFEEASKTYNSSAARKVLIEGLENKKMYGFHRMNPNEFRKPHNRLRLLVQKPKEEAVKLISSFLPKAYRGQPSPEMVQYYIDKATTQLEAGGHLDEVLLKIYKEILCSPRFLFRYEKPGKLNGFEVASRLSYFLWSSMPDDELLRFASNDQLLDRKVLKSQVERMLKDPKADRFVDRFTGQWLDLYKFHDMKPDRVYSEFDEALAWSLPAETRQFFSEVLEKDLPVTDFIHSDWAMLNGRLARHYGIEGIQGMDLRKVKLPASSQRGGLLTQGSILKLTTNATYTSPIKRGVWVLDRLIGQPPSPPPPDVEAIEPDIRGAVTIREQIQKHKAIPSCATCHNKIDYHGLTLENYDVVGGWRDRYRVAKGGKGIDRVELANYPKKMVYLAKPVEPYGETARGEAFADIHEYKNILLKDPDQIARNLAEKLTIYSTGAKVEFADRVEIERIVEKTRSQKHGLRSILHEVVQSDLFLYK